MSEKKRNVLIGTLVGVGAGYLTGILTARKSGKETRNDIANTTINAKNQAIKTIKSLQTNLNDLLKEGEELLEITKSSTKESLSKAIDMATKARDNIKDVLIAVKAGSSNDKDLNEAIEEASKAVEHLKSYLNKDTLVK